MAVQTETTVDTKTINVVNAALDRIQSMTASNALRTMKSVHGLVMMQTDPDFVGDMVVVLAKMSGKWLMGAEALKANQTVILDIQQQVDEMLVQMRQKAEELHKKSAAENKKQVEDETKSLSAGVASFLKLMKASSEDKKRAPIIDQAYVIRPRVKSLWKALVLAAGIWGHPPTVKLTGDPGTGKTMMAQQFAAHLGAVFYKVDCAMFAEPGDLYGKLIPAVDDDGKLQLVWKDSPFTEAVLRGNCVILVDELTRLNYAGQNSLLPLLDGTGEVHPDGRPDPIRRSQGVFIFASCNEGVRHAGTYEITEALQSRMAIVFESETLNESELATVLRYSLRPERKPGSSVFLREKWSVVDVTQQIENLIVQFAKRIREKKFVGQINLVEEIMPPSPRELFWLVRMIHTGGDEAWEWCIYNRYSKEGFGSGQNNNPRSVVAAVKSDEAKRWLGATK